VPSSQGSWVSLTVDPKGRLITSDQYGKLYRITPPAGDKKIEVAQIPVNLGEAQGLLWAFDALYVVVNKGGKYQSGLYRVKASKGDDNLDTAELLRAIDGASEHGPHGVVLSPDGKSLVLVAGNHTKLTKVDRSTAPMIWGEDFLLPRQWDAGGHAVGILAPGGWIARTDPAGKSWELISMGYRNQYDLAYNRDGELFTFDSDMEWDMNTPWYRPTRVCHAVDGSEFGWRSGTGVYPDYYPDNLPPAINIGQGSPTGICFGYGAYFPPKYHEALFLCDWSFGKLYAAHLKEDGASYKGDFEEFITGTPLPLTDIVVNPKDGAMYFTTGGRKVTSGLYRITYIGNETVGRGVVRDVRSPKRTLPALSNRTTGKKAKKASTSRGNILATKTALFAGPLARSSNTTVPPPGKTRGSDSPIHKPRSKSCLRSFARATRACKRASCKSSIHSISRRSSRT